MTRKTLWDAFVKDKSGRVVILQTPNLPLIIWFVGALLAKVIGGSVFSTLAFCSLLLWASLEIGWGDSYFRRVLGLVVLAVIIVNRI
ncbi:MAG TPA: hypothetical protein PKA02_00360 [Candidatus Saccharibacteria bacterium]|nr:hypothetical protein [Candidatus Saccharibacteria bacterium]